MNEPVRRRAVVVEDSREYQILVTSVLEVAGFAVDVFSNGEHALEAIKTNEPTIVLLDLLLEGIGGLEVCRQLRTFSDVYVLMLTSRSEEMDRIIGLTVGADDYLSKPFSPRELVARIDAILRRPRARLSTTADHAKTHRFGDVVIDTAARCAYKSGEIVELTPIEYRIIEVLVVNHDHAVSRDHLSEAVWGTDWFETQHALDVHVSNLRKKLGDQTPGARFIQTVRGFGYRVNSSPS